MKKASPFISVMLALALASAVFLPVPPAFAAPDKPKIRVNAEAAALIDVASGRLLWSHKGDSPMRIASLTKVLTAIVAIENGNLSDQVKVGKNAYRKEGSSLYLKLGEEMSLHNMLYGLMLRSGNDAATAIAEHVGGSVEGFAFMMNEKAEQIGMTHSHFMNPSGLDQEGHYASANDMAKLTAYALHNPVFRDIVKTKEKIVPNPNESWDYKWRNKNKMLFFYEGADGVKTGFTKKAHRTLISSATRGGRQLAVVTLNDGTDWVDHALLLDYGFNRFSLRQLTEKGKPVDGNEMFAAGSTILYPLTDEEQGRISKNVVPTKPGTPAYRLGERGTVQFTLDGAEIARTVLYEKGSLQLTAKGRGAFRLTADDAWTAAGGASGIWRTLGTFLRAVMSLDVK